MGGSRSNASTTSTSNVTTTTSTNQEDNRVAGTDQALVLGNAASLTITQNSELPEEAAAIVQQLVDTNQALGQSAIVNSALGQQAGQREADNANRILIIGLGGVIVIAAIFAFTANKK